MNPDTQGFQERWSGAGGRDPRKLDGPLLDIRKLKVTYPAGHGELVAVRDFDLKVEAGERLAIIGASGSGKSSLLKAINLLHPASSGEIFFAQAPIMDLPKAQLRGLRRGIGFVFQDYNLIDRLSVLENVLLGRLGQKSFFETLANRYTDADLIAATEALDVVGLSEKRLVRADALSGGQRQRVAIAKTLCQSPRLILADEPVSSLDPASSERIMEIFRDVNVSRGISILINLHDVDLARKYFPRIVAIRQGQKVYDGPSEAVSDDVLAEIYADIESEANPS